SSARNRAMHASSSAQSHSISRSSHRAPIRPHKSQPIGLRYSCSFMVYPPWLKPRPGVGLRLVQRLTHRASRPAADQQHARPQHVAHLVVIAARRAGQLDTAMRVLHQQNPTHSRSHRSPPGSKNPFRTLKVIVGSVGTECQQEFLSVGALTNTVPSFNNV